MAVDLVSIRRWVNCSPPPVCLTIVVQPVCHAAGTDSAGRISNLE